MRFLAVALAVTLGIAGLLWLRWVAHAPDRAGTVVTGTVTGRYGVVWGVHITAEAGDRLLAETWTDPNGRYALEVPAGTKFDLRAIPIPETFLIAQRLPLTLARGEERSVGFDLETVPRTLGKIVGPFRSDVEAFTRGVEMRAVREGSPKGTRDVWIHGLTFQIWGLETGAAYHLEAPSGGYWELESPVAFRGGDSGIVVTLRRMLTVTLLVREGGKGTDIAKFAVRVVDPGGNLLATLEGKDGQLSWRVPHPDPYEAWDAKWTLVVGADGYFEETVPLSRYSVFLQPVRDPNIVLHVTREDGAAYQGDVTAYGVPSVGWGSVDARPRKLGDGRFDAVLPDGGWRIWVEPGVGYEPFSCEVTVGGPEAVRIEVPARPSRR